MTESNPIAPIPLVVDLDGSLIRSDLLIESALSFVRQNPLQIMTPLYWLIDGKARLKEGLAEVSEIDVKTLPYNDEVLDIINKARDSGREVVLATASHQIIANQVAEHLGLFDTVLATSENLNLSATAKRDVLVDKYGAQGFDYIGNASDDLSVWEACREAVLIDPSASVESRCTMAPKQVVRTGRQSGRTWAKALRLHQWAKNLLIFVPLVASQRFLEIDLMIEGILAFFLFGLCASATYLMNDLLDLTSDRLHETKKFRPLPDGRISIFQAIFAVPLFILLAFVLAILFLPMDFVVVLGAYCVLTIAYSVTLKRRMMVDVITLSLLYTIRIIAGVFALGLDLTFWMLAFSMFIFLSLALVKRYAELLDAHKQGALERTPGRGYYPSDLSMIASLGAGAGMISVLVLAMYTQQESIFKLYSHPEIIWLTCPMLLYWIGRTWMLTHRGEMHEDPVFFAVTDKISIVTGVLFILTFWLAK